MSLADCMSRWPSTTRRPWCRVHALAQVRLHHRGAGLLDLEEQGVVLVAAQPEHDPAAGAHAIPRPRPCARRRPARSARAACGGRPAACRGSSPRSSRTSSGIPSASTGTSSGGSCLMRTRPSTVSVSLENAWRLSCFLRLRRDLLGVALRGAGEDAQDVLLADARVPHGAARPRRPGGSSSARYAATAAMAAAAARPPRRSSRCGRPSRSSRRAGEGPTRTGRGASRRSR